MIEKWATPTLMGRTLGMQVDDQGRVTASCTAANDFDLNLDDKTDDDERLACTVLDTNNDGTVDTQDRLVELSNSPASKGYMAGIGVLHVYAQHFLPQVNRIYEKPEYRNYIRDQARATAEGEEPVSVPTGFPGRALFQSNMLLTLATDMIPEDIEISSNAMSAADWTSLNAQDTLTNDEKNDLSHWDRCYELSVRVGGTSSTCPSYEELRATE